MKPEPSLGVMASPVSVAMTALVGLSYAIFSECLGSIVEGSLLLF